MKTIIVNGREYDAITGQPVAGSEKVFSKTAERDVESRSIHRGVQKSQTLIRRYVAQPKKQTREQYQAIQQFKRRHDYIESSREVKVRIERKNLSSSNRISHFQPSIHETPKSPIAKTSDSIAPVEKHPLEIQAREIMRQKAMPKTVPSPKVIKEQAISEALEKMRADIQTEKSPSKKFKKPRGIAKKSIFKANFAGFAAGICVLVLGVGYLTYLGLPEISTRIAAVQAGYDVALPAYKPEGYNLKGLAVYDGNSVNVRYGSGDSSYTLKQAKSSWDSLALLDKFVAPKWESDYVISQEKGIVVYKNSRGEAAWVNNGKLYTISGANNLSSDQINKIATSF